MRILFVTNSLKRGGAERQLINLIYNLNKDIEIALWVREKIIQFDPLPAELIVYSSEEKKSLSVIKSLRKAIKNFKPDILHCMEGYVTTHAIVASILTPAIVVNNSIRYGKRYSFFKMEKLLGRFNIWFSKLTVANSKAGLRAYNLKETYRFRVIYNGIDLAKFENLKEKTLLQKVGTTLIGMLASFSAPKDYVTFVKVAIDLIYDGNNIECHFIGYGKEINVVKKLIPDEIVHKFIFWGNQENVEKIICSFDICILLAKKGHSEGLSNAIMEYMASSKVVIATDTGGNSELISEGINGYLIPFEDSEHLKEKIQYLIRHRQERDKMGAAGKDIIKGFSIDKMCDNWKTVYSELIVKKH
jgi:glycosyltransferase involved in cell wall biosynthesis